VLLYCSFACARETGDGDLFAVVEAMASTAKTVKDVPSHDFVRAYAAHLKRSGKVNVPIFCKKEKRIDKGVENL
jgi:hypothetical protein